MDNAGTVLVIACGALAREILALREINQWQHMAVQCLAANLHNRPEKIAPAVREKIHANRGKFASIFVAYGDCGTGGELDRVLAQEGVERLGGAHCYEFFAGSEAFHQLAEDEIGTFYLTDFLLRHFDRLIIEGLGLKRHPELLPMYFGNYKKLVYLGQMPDAASIEAGRKAAQRLGLAYDFVQTGYGGLAHGLAGALQPPTHKAIAWQN